MEELHKILSAKHASVRHQKDTELNRNLCFNVSQRDIPSYQV